MRAALLQLLYITTLIACMSLLVEPHEVETNNILLIGDSLDRFLVDDLCSSRGGQKIDWSENTFKYVFYGATHLCIFDRGALGSLHLFGSAATGPYVNGEVNTADDPHTDSELRVCEGIRIFGKTVGELTWVVFHVSIWDISLMDKTAITGDHTFITQYKGQLVARLEDIDRCKPTNTRVALRTGPHTEWGGNAQVSLNTVIREVAQERKLPLLDYDLAAWSLGASEAEIFKDPNHPNQRISVAFANSIVTDLAAAP